MTEGRKLTLEFLRHYFCYLSRWDKSASLISVVKMIESMIMHGQVSDSQMSDLEMVANYEYLNVKESTTDTVMSLNDVYNLLICERRSNLLDEILPK